MPNWANVTRKIYGSKESLKTIEDAIVKCETANEPIVKNGFGKLWLGCIITALGGDWEKIGCRGEITSYCYENDYLRIESMEAWGEQEEFRHFIEQKFADENGESEVGILYYCSEPGMVAYYTNDSECNDVNVEVYCTDDDGEICDWLDGFDAVDMDDAIAALTDDYFYGEDVDFKNINEITDALAKQNIKVIVNEYVYQED